MTIPQAIITWPTTPRTERMMIVSCVVAGIGAQGIDRRGERYADRAGVAELVRRARLKIGWPSGRAGSSPAPGIAQPCGERRGLTDFGSQSRLGLDERRHLSPEELDRAHHVDVRDGADADV